MTDQPITHKNTLSVGGSQGNTTVPLKLYGATGQTTHLMDLYQDPSQTQPGWGIAALGAMGWGPSGGAAQDTFLSRVATQNGHASDTAGLLVQPYLEVAGGIGFNGALGFLGSGASISQGGAGSLGLILNQDLTVNRDVLVGRNVVMSTSGATIGQGAAGSSRAIVSQDLLVSRLAAVGNYSANFSGDQLLSIGGNTFVATGGTTQTAMSIFPISTKALSAYLSGIDVGCQVGNGIAQAGAAYSINVYQPALGTGATMANACGVHIGAITSGSTTNVSLLIDAPGGPGASAINASGLSLFQTVGVDKDGQNDGTTGQSWLSLGGGGEGIVSPRTAAAPNRFGISILTASTRRLDISNTGAVNVLTGTLQFSGSTLEGIQGAVSGSNFMNFYDAYGSFHFSAGGGAQNFCGVQN